MAEKGALLGQVGGGPHPHMTSPARIPLPEPSYSRGSSSVLGLQRCRPTLIPIVILPVFPPPFCPPLPPPAHQLRDATAAAAAAASSAASAARSDVIAAEAAASELAALRVRVCACGQRGRGSVGLRAGHAVGTRACLRVDRVGRARASRA